MNSGYNVFLFACCFLFSCSFKRDDLHLKETEKFPQSVNLTGTSVKTEYDDYNPLLMGLQDSLLIIGDIENSPYFHVYKIPAFTYLGNFGKEGRGPFEFQNPVFWGQFAHTDRPKIWIYQMSNFKLSLVDVFDALQNKEYEADLTFTMPFEANEANNIMVMNDDAFIASGPNYLGEFLIYKLHEKPDEWIAYRKVYGKELQDLMEKNEKYIDVLKQGVTKMKPDQTRFVKVHMYAPIIDVYIADGTHEFTILLKNFKLPLFRNGVFDPETSGWYENVFLTDQRIYALNRNCNLKQYNEYSCNDAEIHVFNWSGDPLVIYKLNEGIAPAAPFAVDEKNNKVYTVNPGIDDGVFRIFDLPLKNEE
jgi:hypothetical protein